MTYSKALSIIFFLLMAIPMVFGQKLINQSVEKLANSYVGKKKNHGLVIGIIKGDHQEIQGFGQLSKAKKEAPDANTIFEIGSVSSVFTTSLMALESQAGKFKLENRVQDFLPQDIDLPAFTPFICREVKDFKSTVTNQDYYKTQVICEPVPFAAEICINFCDLASHTSGLSNAPKGLYSWNPIENIKKRKDPYKDYSKIDLYKNLRKNDINQAPGIHYHFSNSGIALLGNILGDMNNSTYGEVLEKGILSPLALKDTRLTLSKMQMKNLAPGHARNGKVTNSWHFEAMAPAGGLKSTANDLIKFLDANLHPKDKIFENAFAEVHQSRIAVPKSKMKRSTMAAYGWHVSTLSEASNQPVVWMNGGTGGYRAFIGFIKDTETGIVVLSNSSESVDELAYQILEWLTPLPKDTASK